MWWFSIFCICISCIIFTIYYNSLPIYFHAVAQFNIAVPLVLVFNILDWDSTRRLVNIYGTNIEQNPLAKIFFKTYGVQWWSFPFFYKLVAGSILLAVATFIVSSPMRLALILTFFILVFMAYLEIIIVFQNERRMKNNETNRVFD